MPVTYVNFDELSFSERILGKGTFREVFQGEWLCTPVAIKSIDYFPGFNDRNMIRELKILSELSHDNIIQVRAYCLHRNKLFIAMELFESSDLKTVLFDPILGAKYNLTEKIQLEIAFKISRAIWCLHYKDVVHRDIKPGNILMNERFEIKVCDFGISRVNAMATYLLTMQGKKSVQGTPIYMAPELLLEEKKATLSSDIWCLGCVINEIFVRSLTWDKEMEKEFLHNILRNKSQPDLSKVPAFFKDLLSECFDYDAHKRPTAQKLTECLKTELTRLNKSA